ncbi:MAG TPA: alpha/beta hydrolase [Thermoanaerobaculia bacterium]|nr:alpha/beta hydrolase [Thermoanaerobaculia bacterium]
MKSRKQGTGVLLPLVSGVSTLAALDFARRAFRRSRLFCPDREPARSWNPADYGLPAARTAEQWIESPGGEILHAWHARAEDPIASALYCHGNAGNLTTVAGMIPHLLAAGIDVLLFDYRGFGRSSGKATVRGVMADALAAARFHDAIRPKHLPSLLYGYSLGGAIAVQLLRRHPFDALILQSTFTSLSDIARTIFPRAPVRLLAGRLFDTVREVRRLRLPLFVIHGDCDPTVPGWMARRIYEACSGRKEIRIVEGGTHRDLYARDGDALESALRAFAVTLREKAPEVL